MEVYKAKPGAWITDKDAEVVGPIIAQLFDKGKGTPCDIVKAAKRENSPLHKHFDWDDTSAAYEWRKQQARMLTNSIAIEVIVDGKERLISGFESVTIMVDSKSERRYQSVSDILADPVGWSSLQMDILRELKAIQRKLSDYESLAKATQLRLIDEAVEAFA